MELNLKPETIELVKSLNLSDQYLEQVKILQLLDIFTDVVGIDGKKYLLPSYEEVLKKFDAKIDFLPLKVKQGFTQLLLVPLAMPLDLLIERYEKALVKYYRESNFLNTPNEILGLSADHPVLKMKDYINADIENKIVYYPKRFDKKDHRGLTKKEILESINSSGWEVLLVENISESPRLLADWVKPQRVNGREKLVGKTSAIEYLEKLISDPQYQGEQGLTPEGWMILTMNQVQEKKPINDENEDRGRACYMIGSYFTRIGYVPYGNWERYEPQSILGSALIDYYGYVNYARFVISV